MTQRVSKIRSHRMQMLVRRVNSYTLKPGEQHWVLSCIGCGHEAEGVFDLLSLEGVPDEFKPGAVLKFSGSFDGCIDADL